jgi:hypothetical protein
MSATEDDLVKLAIGAAEDDIVATLLRTIPPLELLRYAEMPEVEHLSGLSEDTVRRHHSDKVRKLSPRRAGMRVIHALLLRNPGTAA